MEVKLVVVGGDAKPTEIKLKLPAIIGRGRAASLTLPHPLVSRQHCELYESGGKLFVRDMGSLNGTFVGEEKVEEAPLDSGSLLTIGNVTFRPIYGAQAAAPAANEVDFEVADEHAGTEPAEFEIVDDDDFEVEEVAEVDDVEELDDVEIAEVDDVEEVQDIEELDDVEEVAESDPLDPPSLKATQQAPQSTPATEKAPSQERSTATPQKKKNADQDDQFLQFLDDEEDGDSSDDEDLNTFLKDFK